VASRHRHRHSKRLTGLNFPGPCALRIAREQAGKVHWDGTKDEGGAYFIIEFPPSGQNFPCEPHHSASLKILEPSGASPLRYRSRRISILESSDARRLRGS
jgi:hypothetical protein